MVKKMIKFFGYTLFFIGTLIFFMPKNSLYFFAEENLKQFDVIISKESLSDKFLSLNVKNMEISAKAIDAGVIEELDITLLLAYNKLEFKNIQLSSLVESYLPSKISQIVVTYSVINPLVIYGRGVGEFGEANLVFHIDTRELVVSLKPSKKMFSHYRNSLAKFKKSETGEYVYAKSF